MSGRQFEGGKAGVERRRTTRPYTRQPCRGQLGRGSIELGRGGNELGKARNDLDRGINIHDTLISELFYL